MKGIFVGIAGGSAQRCLSVVRDAVKKAAWPGRLAFGICPDDIPDASLFFQAAGTASIRLMNGKGLSIKEAWQTVYGLYDGREYAMQVTPEADYLADWDRKLLDCFFSAKAERLLLTSVLQADGTPRAVAVRGFGPQGELKLAPGMKILHALRPPRSFFLSPDLVFGAGEWMQTAGADKWDGSDILNLSLNAFEGGFTPFLVSTPVLRREHCGPRNYEFLPQDELAESLQAFGEAAGIYFQERTAGMKVSLGLNTEDGRYAVKLPLEEGLRQWLRRPGEKKKAGVMLATALGRHAEPPLLDVYLKLFENLAELRRLALCCYCPQEHVKRLLEILPNTYVRREKAGELLSYESEDAFLRSKPYFIAEAARQFPAHTHYGWIDIDYVTHPVYPPAVFTWSNVMDDTIHMAIVNGKADAGLIIMPKEKIGWLVEMSKVLTPDPALGPGDDGLFQCLADTYPEAFTLHPMEKRHMLLSLCQPLYVGGMFYEP